MRIPPCPTRFRASAITLFTLAAVLLLVPVSGLAGTGKADDLNVLLSQSAAERAMNVSPVISPLSSMTVTENVTADQALQATDSDGDPLTFGKSFGPTYMTVTTTDPGTGTATGNVHLAPGTGEAGTTQAIVSVSDGLITSYGSFSVTVARPAASPVLQQPAPVSLNTGQIRDVTIIATDANGDPLTFAKVLGPSFMTVTTTDPGQGTAAGNMRFTPGGSDAGSDTAVVSVSDGVLTDQKSFTVTVTGVPNNPPDLTFINDMFVRAGSFQSQYFYATDADNNFITLTKFAGPAYMTLFLFVPSPGFSSGYIELRPQAQDAGITTGTVQASDGITSVQKSFTITVSADSPPVLAQPQDMSVTIGQILTQTVTATDPDGDYIFIDKVSGPAYMTVESNSSFGSATGTVRLAPGAGEAGTAVGTIRATAFSLTDSASFNITALAGDFPPLCPASTFVANTVPFGSGTLEVQTADLNGDRALDLVVELPDARRVAVALGNGDGTFGPPSDLTPGSAPVSGVIVDLNSDEKPDIVVADYVGDNISVYLGDGAGGFGPRRDFAVGNSPRSITTADVNRDGKADILTSNLDAASVTVLRGLGDGTFSSTTTVPTVSTPWHLATTDLNGDGAPDLLVVSATFQGMLAVHLNNGSGGFAPRATYPVGIDPLAVAAADLNGDGKRDVVVSNSGSNTVSVFLGNGNGTLGTRTDFATDSGPRQIAITDLNGDQLPDISVPNIFSSTVSILLGSGTGLFAPRTDIQTGSGPYGIASGDLDDDLRNDLAVAAYYSGSVTVMLNAGCAPDVDHPPVVISPTHVTGAEGTLISFSITASDPDGPAITSITADVAGLPLGNNAAFTPNAQNSGGTFAWTPTYQHARPTPYPVVFIATNLVSGSATTKVTVTNTNRAPAASTGGPYTAFLGSPLQFNGKGSSDPDGDGLSYLWVFGDGTTGMGAEPSHTYAATGVYGVALTVSDGFLTGIATTTANVLAILQARAFTEAGNKSINLGSGKSQWCVQLESIGNTYSIESVDLTTLVMRSEGTGSVNEIHALTKSVSARDRDGNGLPEITACFGKADLRLLFSDVHGNKPVPVTIQASLFAGGILRASLDVGVNASGGKLVASINPNPLNPSSTLTFFTSQPGLARVRLFDPQGRLVRTLLEESSIGVGYHDLTFDGRDDRGTNLASGVYYYRVEAAEGDVTGRFTVLR